MDPLSHNNGTCCEVNATGQKEYKNSLAFRVLRNIKNNYAGCWSQATQRLT